MQFATNAKKKKSFKNSILKTAFKEIHKQYEQNVCCILLGKAVNFMSVKMLQNYYISYKNRQQQALYASQT